MVKNCRIECRLDKEDVERLDMKVKQTGCENRTEFLEKICREPIIFLDNVRQKFKSEEILKYE